MIARLNGPAVGFRALFLTALLLYGGGRTVSGQEPPTSPEVPAATEVPAGSVAPPGPPAGETTADPAAPPGAVVPTEMTRPSGAAFMKPLGRLASILGSVHFLRTLCGDENAAIWREKMSELVEAQAPNEADRKILIASFNGGYRAFESTYRKCTPAARVAVGRYQQEGAELSREIGARYGN